MSASTDYAGQQIENVRAGRSKRIELHEQLDWIPPEIFGLTHLEELDLRVVLGEGNIRAIPEQVCGLRNLKVLDLSDHPIEKVPDIPGLILNWESYLRCRQDLSAANVLGLDIRTEVRQRQEQPLSQASELIPTLVALPSLRRLRIGLSEIAIVQDLRLKKPTGAIAELINGIGQFDSLEELEIRRMLLGEVPQGMRELRRLRRLALFATWLRNLPDWLSELRGLSELRLSLICRFPLLGEQITC